MSDKEPRRRKKRKDLQKKDDMRSEEPSFLSQKSDSKDSDDAELEEELPVPSHQPSQTAKVVFVLLFSGLVVAMSFVFLALQGAEKGPIDVFDGLHAEEHEELHIEEDAHGHNAVDTAHDDFDILPDLGSLFKFEFKDDKSEEISETITTEQLSPSSIDDTFTTASYFDHDANEDLLQRISEESESQGEQVEEKEEDMVTEETTIDSSIAETFTEAFSTVSSNAIYEDQDDDTNDKEIENAINDYVDDNNDDQDEITPLETSDIDSITEESEAILEAPQKDSFLEHSNTEPVKEQKPVPTEQPVKQQKTIPTEEPVKQKPVPTEEPVKQQKPVPTEEPVVRTLPSDVFEDMNEEFSFYEHADITNREDYLNREELDDIDRVLKKSPEKALKMSEELSLQLPKSPRLQYAKSQALDRLAELQKSNKYLEEAIAAYQKVLQMDDVPEKLYLTAGRRAVDRMRFRGLMGKSLRLLIEMSERFPNNIDIKNQIAVGYLLIGQNKESKKAFIEVLKLVPESGLAKVHLGFILKTDELNYKEAIILLSEGIASREAGVIDGRFFFHLGDALHRLGKQDEAMKVYEEGVKEGLFLSAYQRSLYNEKGLTGKPWWDPQKTKYSEFFKVLEKNWLAIKNEATSLMDAKSSGFLPETENLQDTGDWKQFELFARGRKVEKNCIKTPSTCALIEKMPDASGCKRGQVKFSIMHPATHVWAHTGPTNCRLRSHLGLVVPEGASIRVANETRQWREGKVMLFDDSFEHEVWHNGTSFRLVLIVDFWHPELTSRQKNSLTPI